MNDWASFLAAPQPPVKESKRKATDLLKSSVHVGRSGAFTGE